MSAQYILLNLLNKMGKRDQMGLNVRKPVFGGLRTTQAQTSLCIGSALSVPLLFAITKVSNVNLLQAKFRFSS